MAGDTQYKPSTLIYKSRGLVARFVEDQAPQNVYLDNRNCFEREENSLSTRYGTRIINRTADNAPSQQNYLFNAPVVTLAKMTYGGIPSRYAGLADGTLQRRNSNDPGAYTQIYSGLSGSPFQTNSTNCYQTSQSYLFIFDAAASIKDSGITGTTPTLTGLDPSSYTANTLPFSPLLTMIDIFAQGNSYTTSGFLDSWAWSSITTLTAAASSQVTDFPQYFGVTNPSTLPVFTATTGSFGVLQGVTLAGSGSANMATGAFNGFPSQALAVTDTVTLVVTLASEVGFDFSYLSGTGTVAYQYSIDGGTTWTTFYQYVGTAQADNPIPALTVQIPVTAVTGLTNLANLQVRFVATLTGQSFSLTGAAIARGRIDSISATVDQAAAVDPFAGVTDGMLSVLTGTAPTAPQAIVSVESVTPDSNGLFQQLLVTMKSAHGKTSGSLVALYGVNSQLLNGFYTVASAPSPTTLLVPYSSLTYLKAQGGYLTGGQAQPEAAVLTNRYASPNPTQFSAWGFYQQVPTSTLTFPVGYWSATVAQNTTTDAPATVGVTTTLDLSYNGQVIDDDLIVLTLYVSNPAAVDNIRLQFDVRGSGYTSSYYYKDIAPAYYQAGVQNLENAYTVTEQQILADTLGLLTGTPASTTTNQLRPGNISTGQRAWVTVYLRRGDFIRVGTAGEQGVDWSAITGWQLVITTNTVGSTVVGCNGLYLQWGYGPSSFGGVGFDYRFTPFNANTGTDGNGTPIQRFNEQFGWLASESSPTFLRQAAQVTGQYYTDPQVTHVRAWRRGGSLTQGWRLDAQFPNVPAAGTFKFKDTAADLALAQAKTLVLDNDPPVTSSLRVPIQTTLTSLVTSPGSSIYSQFIPQTVTVANSSATFVPTQIVIVGYANNLEQVRVITGGTGQFTAIFRLQHNPGEDVVVESKPRAKCNLCALAYDTQWVAGDPDNPHYLYRAKRGQPENFAPQDYIRVGSPSYPITIVVNWRGNLFVATTQTWWLIVGGANPYPQPTGSIHGAISSEGWAIIEGGIAYRAADGWRLFNGGDGEYVSLPVEMVFRQQPQTPVPLTDPNQASSDVFAFYNNTIIGSYVSLDGGLRYRLLFDLVYKRWRYDDVAATAMLWEQDTRQLLAGVPITTGANAGKFAIVQDWVLGQDYDDIGWQPGGSLGKQPVSMIVQTPYEDMGAPHFPKQFNMVETDVDTNSQTLHTQLLVNAEPRVTIPLADTSDGFTRGKLQLQVLAGKGYEAYSVSIRHTMVVLEAPTLYQENIYAAGLADRRSSFDSYWQVFGTEELKAIKQGYFDYTSTVDITVSLYAQVGPEEGTGSDDIPYFTFTLPAQDVRRVVRQLFLPMKCRRWRMVGTCSNSPDTNSFQLWSVTCDVKPVKEGSTWSKQPVAVRS